MLEQHGTDVFIPPRDTVRIEIGYIMLKHDDHNAEVDGLRFTSIAQRYREFPSGLGPDPAETGPVAVSGSQHVK